MRFLTVILLLFCSAGTIAQTDYDEMLKEYYKNSVLTIKPASLMVKMKSGETIHLLDTREAKEFAVSHLSKAVHVGYDNFKVSEVKDIPKDETIIVYCTIGARSENVGEQLIKAGYDNVYNLYGGIIQWVNSGYPVVNAGKETSQVHVYSKEWGKWLKKGKAVYK